MSRARWFLLGIALVPAIGYLLILAYLIILVRPIPTMLVPRPQGAGEAGGTRDSISPGEGVGRLSTL